MAKCILFYDQRSWRHAQGRGKRTVLLVVSGTHRYSAVSWWIGETWGKSRSSRSRLTKTKLCTPRASLSLARWKSNWAIRCSVKVGPQNADICTPGGKTSPNAKQGSNSGKIKHNMPHALHTTISIWNFLTLWFLFRKSDYSLINDVYWPVCLFYLLSLILLAKHRADRATELTGPYLKCLQPIVYNWWFYWLFIGSVWLYIGVQKSIRMDNSKIKSPLHLVPGQPPQIIRENLPNPMVFGNWVTRQSLSI